MNGSTVAMVVIVGVIIGGAGFLVFKMVNTTTDVARTAAASGAQSADAVERAGRRSTGEKIGGGIEAAIGLF